MLNLVWSKWLRRLLAFLVGGYFALALCSFLYYSALYGPGLGIKISDEIFGRGIIMRLLNPPVRDELLEQVFKNNRSKFESVIELQSRICSSADTEAESARGEMDYINKTLGILRVSSDEANIWSEAPYSSAAILKNKAINEYREGRIKEIQRIDDEKLREAALIDLYRNIKSSICPFQAVSIVLEETPHRSNFIKGIKYFPAAPRVDSMGMHLPNKYTGKISYAQVESDLDGLALGFFTRGNNCAYKMIEEKWFIFACK